MSWQDLDRAWVGAAVAIIGPIAAFLINIFKLRQKGISLHDAATVVDTKLIWDNMEALAQRATDDAAKARAEAKECHAHLVELRGQNLELMTRASDLEIERKGLQRQLQQIEDSWARQLVAANSRISELETCTERHRAEGEKRLARIAELERLVGVSGNQH